MRSPADDASDPGSLERAGSPHRRLKRSVRPGRLDQDVSRETLSLERCSAPRSLTREDPPGSPDQPNNSSLNDRHDLPCSPRRRAFTRAPQTPLSRGRSTTEGHMVSRETSKRSSGGQLWKDTPVHPSPSSPFSPSFPTPRTNRCCPRIVALLNPECARR